MKVIYSLMVALGIIFSTNAQNVKVIKFEELVTYLNEPSDKLRIVNIWATWCKPCIKELPHFQTYYEEHQSNGTEMLLVSLDFVEDLQKVENFVEKRGITAKVNLLDETDYNSFIDKIDPRWSGAIPATIIIKGERRLFVEKELLEGDLEKLIEELNN